MPTATNRTAKGPATSNPTTLPAPLLDTDAVATVLGVTPRHIRRLVAERRIPFVKVGRFVRFDPGALNVWLDQQRVDVGQSTYRNRTEWDW
jgi:excisionase family DNA binding protein